MTQADSVLSTPPTNTPKVVQLNDYRKPPQRPRPADSVVMPAARIPGLTYSDAVFSLPFITLPAGECVDWGAFWKETEMWNDEPTDQPHVDHERGRRYAALTIAAIRRDGASSRQLEIIVERMIERAFRRRGPAGKLCRQLSYAEIGFIFEVCVTAAAGAVS